MTPEEKAESFVKNEVCIKNCPIWKAHNGNCDFSPKCHHIDSKIKCYLAGHEEGFDAGYKKATGRAYERQQDLTDTYIKDGEKIKQLEKENAELKERLQIESQSVHEQCKIISRLVEQIEKMKNVGNCKKAMLCAEWNEKQCILGQMRFCLNCKEWRLAE